MEGKGEGGNEKKIGKDGRPPDLSWLNGLGKLINSRPPSKNMLRVFQISSKSIPFWQNYSRRREHRQNAP